MTRIGLKALCLSLIFCMVVVFTCGCGSANNAEVKSTDELAQTLVSELHIQNVTKISTEKLVLHYNISQELFENATAYLNQNEESADQVAVFSLKSGSDYNQVCNEIGAQLSQIANSFKDHSSIEYKKVSNVVIKILGNNLIIVICNNPSLASNVLAKMGATDYTKGA